MKPTLVGPRATLRPVAPDRDAERVAALLRLPEVRRFLCDDRVLTGVQVRGLLERETDLAPRGLGFWTGWTADAGFVALLGLTEVDAGLTAGTPIAGAVEPSVALHPSAWGRGLAAEMLGLLIGRARELGLPRLAGIADAPNLRSRAMLARAGFRPLDLRAQGAVYEAVLHELALAPGPSGA